MDLQSGTSPGSVLSVSVLSTPSATDLAVLGSRKHRLVVFSSRPVTLLWMSVCPDWPNHQVIRVSHFRNFNLHKEEKAGLENKSRHSYNTDKGFMPSSYILSLVIWNVTPIVRNGTEYVVKSGVLRWATDTTAYTLREQGKGRSDTLQRKGWWDHRWRFYSCGQMPGSVDCYQKPTKTRTGPPELCRSRFLPVRLNSQPTPWVVTFLLNSATKLWSGTSKQNSGLSLKCFYLRCFPFWAGVFLKPHLILYNMFSLRKQLSMFFSVSLDAGFQNNLTHI